MPRIVYVLMSPWGPVRNFEAYFLPDSIFSLFERPFDTHFYFSNIVITFFHEIIIFFYKENQCTQVKDSIPSRQGSDLSAFFGSSMLSDVLGVGSTLDSACKEIDFYNIRSP